MPQLWQSRRPTRWRAPRQEGLTHHPLPMAAGWTGGRFCLGMNKEAFDAELFAFPQALDVFRRNETGRRYTIFSDSEAKRGSGKRHAAAAIEVAETLMRRDNSVTTR